MPMFRCQKGVKFKGIPGINLLPDFTCIRQFILNLDAQHPTNDASATQAATRGVALRQQPSVIPYGLPTGHKGMAHGQVAQTEGHVPCTRRGMPWCYNPPPPCPNTGLSKHGDPVFLPF